MSTYPLSTPPPIQCDETARAAVAQDYGGYIHNRHAAHLLNPGQAIFER